MKDNQLAFDANECLIFPDVSGEQVAEYRKRIGLSQREFSKDFDIPLGTLRRWEQDQSTPSKSRLSLFEINFRKLRNKYHAV